LIGGLILGLSWTITGLLWCITIVGIPVGMQCFEIGKLYFWTFGKEISYGKMGATSAILNILWIIFGGIELAAASALVGAIFCITIVFIPFGVQCFKLAMLALMPFGAEIR